MHQIAPGLHHWTAIHPAHGQEVSSYYLDEERSLLDPLVPDDVLAFLDERPPEHAVLTNRHHWRSCDDLRERYPGMVVHVHELGLHEFDESRPVQPFAFGDELPGGLRAHEVGVLTPEETAVEVPRLRALAFADAIMRRGDGPLGFFPDGLLGDDPEAVKRGTRARVGELAEQLQPDIVLLAHGDPIVGGAAAQLLAFARGG
jgi:hypothetical protein